VVVARRTNAAILALPSGHFQIPSVKIDSSMRILLADDDRAMAETLRHGLEEKGHQVTLAFDGNDALSITLNYDFDVLVLDVMMPGMDGIAVARRLRDFRNQTPILMLTARDAMEDVVRGLDQGADDYITKPFSFQILLARIRAIARRGPIQQPLILRVSDLALDPASREVQRGDRRVDLTPTEYKLLEVLMRRAGRVVAREILLDTVWGLSADVESNTLDAFIRLLRQKIDADGPKLLHTVRTVGYCLRDPSGES
jgi:DNA-binding response OmpR family regulator